MEELRSRAIAAATALVKNTKKYVLSPKIMVMSPTTKPPKPNTKMAPPPPPPPPPPPKDPPPKPKKPDIPPPCIEPDSGGGGTVGSVAVEKKSRAMKFPYTHTAKFVQMPWLYYFKNNWHYKYFVFSVILCLPVFKYIQDGMNSPTNVAKWEALQAKDREEQAAHHH